MASDMERLSGLVDELRKLSSETRWVEFKEDNSNPNDIGEYLSALSNMAALEGKESSYLVWGICNETHEVVGTSFRPRKARKGNEELENWLLRLLDPKLHFQFDEIAYGGKQVVVLEIPPAPGRPVRFRRKSFVRVGSYRQKLDRHPQIERELWRVFNTTRFEDGLAAERLDGRQALSRLDYLSYFDLLKQTVPASHGMTLARLEEDRIVKRDHTG